MFSMDYYMRWVLMACWIFSTLWLIRNLKVMKTKIGFRAISSVLSCWAQGLEETSHRKRVLFGFGLLSVGVALSYFYDLFYIFPKNKTLDGTLIALIVSVPVAWILWIWRNRDKLRTIEFGELTENTRGFLQLAKTATNKSLRPPLRIAAVMGFKPFLAYQKGERFFTQTVDFFDLLLRSLPEEKKELIVSLGQLSTKLEIAKYERIAFINSHYCPESGRSADDDYYLEIVLNHRAADSELNTLQIDLEECQKRYHRKEASLKSIEQIITEAHKVICYGLLQLPHEIEFIGGIDLSGLNIVGALGRLKIKEFRGITFDNAIIDSDAITITNKKFSSCGFARVKFRNCTFTECTFSECVFSGAEFTDVQFSHCYFESALFGDAICRNQETNKPVFHNCQVTGNTFETGAPPPDSIRQLPSFYEMIKNRKK